jgi:hypothetical protein
MIRTLRLVLVSLTLAGCSHPAPSSGGTDVNLITQEELAGSEAPTAYDAVLKLRGNFLSDRGKTTILGNSPSKPMVYLDGIRYGDVQSLRTIATSTVAQIRLYRAWEAQQKFGTGNMGGVIEVTTRQQ